MDLKDYPHYFLYIIFVYLVTLAYGLDFLLSSAAYGILEGYEALLISVVILLPAVLLAMYALKGRAWLLYNRRNALRAACTIAMLASSAFTAVFIIPLTF